MANYRDLLRYRTLLEARSDSRQFYFGLGWWVVEPLVYLTVLYLVFGVILQRGGPGFAGFLLVGFVFFRWMDSSAKKAMHSLTAASGILTQARLPAWLFPVSDMLSNALRFTIVLLLLVGFAAWYSGQAGLAYLALLPLLALNLAFNLALGLCLSLLPPYFPDSRKIVDNLFSLLFFASGIFYDIRLLAPEYERYLHINPIAAFLTAYRQVLLENELPGMAILQWPVLFTLALGLAALLGYRRLGDGLPRALLR